MQPLKSHQGERRWGGQGLPGLGAGQGAAEAGEGRCGPGRQGEERRRGQSGDRGDSPEASEDLRLRAAAWLCTVSVPPTTGPLGDAGCGQRGSTFVVLQALLSILAVCHPGQVTHLLWPWEGQQGTLRAARPSGDKPPGWGLQCSPHLGLGSWWPGVGLVAKETGHHPSRRLGSVLNCLL